MLPAALTALKYLPYPNMESKTTRNLLIGVAAVGVGYLGYNWYKKYQKDNAGSKVADTPAAAQALALFSALYPSGFSLLRWVDGVKSENIYAIAETITDYEAVRDLYSKQNEGRSLEDDLSFKLSTNGLQKFLALASKGKTGDKKYSKVREDIPVMQWVITNAEANIRKTPKKENAWLPGNNIVRTVPANRAIGATTGKFAYDEINDVTFIEFYTFNAKKEKTFFYVAKSQVFFISDSEKKKRDSTPNKIPFEVLAGINGGNQKQIISTQTATIYADGLKPLYTAPAKLILGFPIMELNTGTEVYIQFQTVQGFTRWVKKSDTKTVDR